MLSGMPNNFSRSVIPAVFDDVVEHGPRSVGPIGDVFFAAGQVPDQPAIHGAEGQFAGLGLLPGAARRFPESTRSWNWKSRDRSAAPSSGGPSLPPSLHLVAAFGGSAILPDDCVVDRLACFPVPDDGRFPLVGNAHRRQVTSPYARLAQNLNHRAHLRGKDVEGIMLNPPALGVDLLELPLQPGQRYCRLCQKEWNENWWFPDRAKECTPWRLAAMPADL